MTYQALFFAFFRILACTERLKKLLLHHDSETGLELLPVSDSGRFRLICNQDAQARRGFESLHWLIKKQPLSKSAEWLF